MESEVPETATDISKFRQPLSTEHLRWTRADRQVMLGDTEVNETQLVSSRSPRIDEHSVKVTKRMDQIKWIVNQDNYRSPRADVDLLVDLC